MSFFRVSLALPALGVALAMLLSSRRLLHYFQLESYQFHGYFRTLLRQRKRALLPGLYLSLWCVAVWLGFAWWMGNILGSMTGGQAAGFSVGLSDNSAADTALYLLPGLCAMLLCTAGGYLIRRASLRQKAKKKLVVTPRIKRLYIVHALVVALLCALLGRFAMPVLAAYLPIFLPLILAISALIALPIEKFIFFLYFKDAEKKLLRNPGLIRIGVTGSYGKTSVKFILAGILSQKYNVLATPASFNTPMGVTRIIRERLTPAHQVFIAEMGARHVGEINELCRLAHPVIGVLTAVGPQHLDTFRTLERIRDTKYELIQALPKDGYAVFSDDGDIVRGLYEKTDRPKALVGVPNGAAWAENVQVSGEGSSFLLCMGDMEPLACKTALLGEHNIRNILLSATVALHLGLSRDQIARGIASLKPVEHRLQLLRSSGGVTIIDDAFNSNPRSCKAAFQVLGSFAGRRIVVTPGLVELGAKEDQFNYELGRAIVGNADLCFLVGKKHTAPIRKGLLDAGFPDESIFISGDLAESTAKLNPLLRPGDVVLYENDLPDHYNEN